MSERYRREVARILSGACEPEAMFRAALVQIEVVLAEHASPGGPSGDAITDRLRAILADDDLRSALREQERLGRKTP